MNKLASQGLLSEDVLKNEPDPEMGHTGLFGNSPQERMEK